jgi:hypothetical protein
MPRDGGSPFAAGGEPKRLPSVYLIPSFRKETPVMKLLGNQIRETLAQAGYELVGRRDDMLLLRNEAGGHEIYAENDRYPGYVVELGGLGYRFLGTPAAQEVIDFFAA